MLADFKVGSGGWPPPPPACTAPFQNCWDTRCCAKPAQRCFTHRTGKKYAQCMDKCAATAAHGWECEDVTLAPPAPPAESPPPSPPPPSPSPAPPVPPPSARNALCASSPAGWAANSWHAPALSAVELDCRFASWAAGKTGYPLVDACMRCLDATAWLTFRMRCLCVSFACYHLWLHWRRPAIWLARRFLDFEPAIHFCQMQMQAGCAEYVEMRVYNPIKQAQDQDPEGEFIRRWVPELRNVPLKYLHEPARMPKREQREAGCVLGVDYPKPIVDHQQAYERAKRALQARRNAMGWASLGAAQKRGAAPAAARGGGEDNHDLRTMLGKKRQRDDDCTLSRAEGRVTSPDAGALTERGDVQVGAVVERRSVAEMTMTSPKIGRGHDNVELGTREQLMAAGFPPGLAQRAASAYPDNVERAADWILSSGEW